MNHTRGLVIGAAEALVVVASEPDQGHDQGGAIDALLPAAVVLDLAAGGHLRVEDGRVVRVAGADDGPRRRYERAALELGDRLEGPLPDVLWSLTDGLRPLPRLVADQLLEEGRIDAAKTTLLKMDFGYRFPALDRAFHDAVEERVRAAYEAGDVDGVFGRTALLVAVGRRGAQVLPGADDTAMERVLADPTVLEHAGIDDATTIVLLQQLTTTLQQILLR